MSVNPEVACWATVAARTGGQLQLRHIFKGPRQDRRRVGLPSLSAQLAGVHVHGEVTGDGDPPAIFAQLAASAPDSLGLKLRIYRNYLYPQFGRVVGIQDLVIGDPHFDRNFIVKSNDTHYAKLWLSEQIRHFILAAPDYCFEIDGLRVTATSHRADDPAQLEAALWACAHLARRGSELGMELARLTHHLGSTSPGDQPWLAGHVEFISGGRKVELTIFHGSTGKRGNRRLLSRLWCRRLTARSDRFVFYADHLPRKERPQLATKLVRCELGTLHPPGYVVHASSGQRLSHRLSEHWSRTITRLAPLLLTCTEGAVELIWPGAILREQLLRDAAGLCEYFAVEDHGVISAGPYR